VHDGINLTRVWFGTLITHHMTQKRDTFRSKTTFAWIQFQVHFPEFEKDSIQVLKVPFPIFTMYIEIVNKYLQEFVPKLLKNY
jgi:hypothetical protein